MRWLVSLVQILVGYINFDRALLLHGTTLSRWRIASVSQSARQQSVETEITYKKSRIFRASARHRV